MSINVKLANLKTVRGVKLKDLEALVNKASFDPVRDAGAYETAKKAVTDVDAQIAILSDMAEFGASRVPASFERDPYVLEKSLVLGGITRMVGAGHGGSSHEIAKDAYGERHPVTKALQVSAGSAGGVLVPPDTMAEITPLLRAETAVRAAGPRLLDMPRGNMSVPRQTGAAVATYGSEVSRINTAQPAFGGDVATYKKLRAIVPISNDLLRYSSPGVDALVRDDLLQVMALREDLAFLTGDGTQDSPRGMLSALNTWAVANGGTAALWKTTAASTYGANGPDPANSTGGNFISSVANFNLATVHNELVGAVTRLASANVKERKRVWFMHPRTFLFLAHAKNSLFLPVYPEILEKGTLFGYPIMQTTQIGTNFYDSTGNYTDCSFVMIAEMMDTIIFDAATLELLVSKEASIIDQSGNVVSAVQNDMTFIRGIAEHDFQMRQFQSVAVIQGVRWQGAAF